MFASTRKGRPLGRCSETHLYLAAAVPNAEKVVNLGAPPLK
jgi:hypothetical protein